jgi:hypothetical protein
MNTQPNNIEHVSEREASPRSPRQELVESVLFLIFMFSLIMSVVWWVLLQVQLIEQPALAISIKSVTGARLAQADVKEYEFELGKWDLSRTITITSGMQVELSHDCEGSCSSSRGGSNYSIKKFKMTRRGDEYIVIANVDKKYSATLVSAGIEGAVEAAFEDWKTQKEIESSWTPKHKI